MIAHFGIRVLTLLTPVPQVETPPPPPPVVVAYIGTTDSGTFDGGVAPDMTEASGSGDGIAVDTGDGTTITDYDAATWPTYDAAWVAYLCEAKPVACR
jgi:hypothetical protein